MHTSQRYFLLRTFCCWLLSCVVVNAQELKFSHIGSDQGLSQAVANDIFQDKQGFMWFATQEGLNKYDGYTFTIYKNDPNDSSSIANGYLNTIIQDVNGKYWIGTNGGGADMLDDLSGKFSHYAHQEKDPKSISNNFVRTIFEDRDQQLWFGTEKGLNLLDRKTNTFTRFLHDSDNVNSISGNIINDIFQDRAGNLWIGTQDGGLCMYDKKTGRFTSHLMSADEINLHIMKEFAWRTFAEISDRVRRIRSIYQAADGMLWCGTDGAGVLIFDPVKKVYLKAHIVNSGKIGIRALSICNDEYGRIWIGTYGNGIYIYNPANGNFENHIADERNSYALNHNDIKCILQDNGGNIWVGAAGGGINVHFKSMNKFSHIKRSERPEARDHTLKSEFVMAVLEDHQGLLWIGTYGGGLTSINRKTNEYRDYPELSTASQNAILGLMEDVDGNIWVATYGDGINMLNRKTGKVSRYNPPRFMAEGTVLCMTQDKNKNIWYGTFDSGVYCLNPETNEVKSYTTKDGLSGNGIFALYFDHLGKLWIGTAGGGLMCMNTQTGKVITYQNNKEDKNSLSNNFINCISEDSKGRIWIGTRNGLNAFTPETNKFSVWYESDGLVNNYIYGILVDSKDNLWMSSNKGVTCFDPAAENENGSAFRNFGVNDGLQRGEFNQGAYYKSKNSEFFFGGIYGLNTFFPEKIKLANKKPSVYLTSYKRFGKEVKLDTSITYKKYIELSWKDNYISFEFTALDFAMPWKNKYQYKLEGFDDDWSPPSSNRIASYTNLPGGVYTFRVRAANSEGVWNETGTSLQIRIIPPFWKTNWFYALSVLFIIACIFGFIRYRTGAIQKENKILEQRVQERTYELAQKNADITASIEYAKRIQSAMLPPLDLIFKHLPDCFVLYRPKDIVSGDFYWFGEKNNRKIIVAADCTGHGVPGALMSMIGHNLLNQIVLEKGITEPGKILTALNEGVRNALKQGHHQFEGQNTSDGMDICLCSIDETASEIQYAGALRPLVVVRKGQLSKVDSDRYPIGGHQDNNDLQYTTHTFTVEKSDTIYLFSDGYADQFGGEKGKKFMVKRMQDMLLSIQRMNMPEQGRHLDKTITEWMGSMQQVDDILVIGIRF